MKIHAIVTFLMATFIMGCEVEIDPNAFFPQGTDFAWWTAMKKRETGYDAANADWEWQNVNNDGEIELQGKVAV